MKQNIFKFFVFIIFSLFFIYLGSNLGLTHSDSCNCKSSCTVQCKIGCKNECIGECTGQCADENCRCSAK